MSAWKVADETIKSIVTTLARSIFREEYRYFLKRWEIEEDKDFDILAKIFMKLNDLSLLERYGDKMPELPDTRFWSSEGEILDNYQMLKSLHCLSYQSCEGWAEQTRWYKFLDELIGKWADYIATKTKQYDEARWR